MAQTLKYQGAASDDYCEVVKIALIIVQYKQTLIFFWRWRKLNKMSNDVRKKFRDYPVTQIGQT